MYGNGGGNGGANVPALEVEGLQAWYGESHILHGWIWRSAAARS